MDTIREVFKDWTEIDTASRLRGALLHAARILDRQNKLIEAAKIRNNVLNMPQSMSKESINYILYAVSVEHGLIS